MKIINEYPPNIEAIKAVFPLADKMDVCFAYAPDIYHPGGNGKMYAHIIMHEKVHIERQLKIGVEAWWDRYLTNVRFRYYEELLAHRAEYEHLAKNSPQPSGAARAPSNRGKETVAGAIWRHGHHREGEEGTTRYAGRL